MNRGSFWVTFGGPQGGPGGEVGGPGEGGGWVGLKRAPRAKKIPNSREVGIPGGTLFGGCLQNVIKNKLYVDCW